MQPDPAEEWRRLAEEYRGRSADELRELAADFSDLTETAQQVLRQEMHSRGLGAPEAPREAGPRSISVTVVPAASMEDPCRDGSRSVFGTRSRIGQLVPDTPEFENGDARPHEYTWKTPLCDCDGQEKATQLQEVLRRAGIECWFNFGGYTTSYVPSIAHSLVTGGIQVLVAADQLDQARIIAVTPIPQDIVDASKQEIPEFVEPKCPKCGAEDPILDAVEPANQWRCEQCGAQWRDPAEIQGQNPANSGAATP